MRDLEPHRGLYVGVSLAVHHGNRGLSTDQRRCQQEVEFIHSPEREKGPVNGAASLHEEAKDPTKSEIVENMVQRKPPPGSGDRDYFSPAPFETAS